MYLELFKNQSNKNYYCKRKNIKHITERKNASLKSIYIRINLLDIE